MRVVDNEGGGGARGALASVESHLNPPISSSAPTASKTLPLVEDAAFWLGFHDSLITLVLARALYRPVDDNVTWQFIAANGTVQPCSLPLKVVLPSPGVTVSEALAYIKSHTTTEIPTSLPQRGRICFGQLYGNDERITLETDLAEQNREIEVVVRTWKRSADLPPQDLDSELESYTKHLGRILQHPDKRVDEIIEPSERDLEQLWAWNGTVPQLIQRCMHDIFLEQAQAQPDAVAVQSWDGSLTYAELERLSAKLARHLVARGVQIGTRIPLCFEKSRWATVSLLGAMRAGATFSLTDPSQPEARLRTIVEQTGAELVITSVAQAELGRRISQGNKEDGSGGHVLAISADFFEADLCLIPEDQLPTVPPSTPMYIIFTSGSTGKPKGVVCSHENYTSGAIPRADAVGYRSHSRVFDFPSYAFDVSIDCMLCTLAVGGRICVPSEEARVNDLSGAIRDSKANMVHMTPSVARVLDADIIPSLDVLGLGGEAVSPSDAADWSRNTSLIIAYGPSECTVGCTINNTVTLSTGIGRGVGGVAWIVDPNDHDHLMPVGSVGELIVEGPVVGLGYLGEPGKTAEVFIQSPKWLVAGYGSVPGRRERLLYKTGDLVRYEAHNPGSIEFIGRKDQQVKLRGQRVELAEVEYHLRACLPANVKAAAEVIKPDNGSGAPTLVAFLCESDRRNSNSASASGDLIVEPSPELSAAIASVDSTMGARVPRYMVPAAFIALRDMPTLVSRKTDRKQLREIGRSIPRETLSRLQAPGQSSGDQGEEDQEPETDTEKQLQRAWVKVLGLGSETKIHRRSSFFLLGGDSLRAMKLISAARDEGLTLTVADVFKNPTLRDMAAKTTAAAQDASQREVPAFSLLSADWTPEQARLDTSSLCSISPDAVEDVYPCTPLQEALMALSAKVKEAYIAQRVVELYSPATAERLIAAFAEAQKGSPVLRTRIVQVPGRGLMQVVVRGELTWHSGTDLQAYLTADRDEAMDLGKPLVRYAVVTEGSKTSFVLTMHHALYDGWSMPLVVDRVNKAYLGEAPPSRPAEFKNFIQYLAGQSRTESETFWREKLHGAGGPQFPALPRQGYQTKADSLLEVYVPLKQQQQQSSASNVTVATIIRAAWALVASQYINTDDILFGETLTGRNAPVVGADEIEGPMITTVPIRVCVDRGLRVPDYLSAIQEQTIAQIPHEHFGLQHIRRLSPNALDACELRTGLVLHPSTAAEDLEAQSGKLPADLLVPAGDSEAAQEALKFNTYALMLVCSIDPDGFLVMASFDSNTATLPLMKRALDQLRLVAQLLYEKAASTSSLAEIVCLADAEVNELHDLARGAATSTALAEFGPNVTAAYVVHSQDTNRLLPIEGIGNVLVCSSVELSLTEVPAPAWAILTNGHIQNRFYSTDKLGKFTLIRELIFTGPVPPNNPARMVSAGDNQEQSATAATYVSATSRKQRRLRALWARVLQIPEDGVGLNDDFFLRGGDSIAAMKLVSEARSEGIRLSVVQVFEKRSLYDMANAMEEDEEEPEGKNGRSQNDTQTVIDAPPFSLLDTIDADSESFITNIVRPQLSNPSAWTISNVLPTRPLQQVAVRGTTQLPRYSCRYELTYFQNNDTLDEQRLRSSCRELVARNEILRTVFIEHASRGYAVVVEDLEPEFVEYDIDGPVDEFARQLCRLDVMTRMPLGSSFVKFFLVRGSSSSCLVFRLSHAQYDEMCLPHMLHQLSALYQGHEEVPASVPFSSYVAHIMRENIPASMAYWRDLLQGSSLSVLRPDGFSFNEKPSQTKHFAIQATLDISSRPRDTTVATLPTASWALFLARRLGSRDVTFGEVVSGRSTGFPQADAVVGPCWQYVPVRVRFGSWTGNDLLAHIQRQHVASAAHEGIGLSELVEAGCCTGWPGVDESDSSAAWFDTVVHQDVAHVETLDLSSTASRMETVYPHEEPLREWKMQAYVDGDTLTLEIVTFEGWAEYARGVLDDLVGVTRQLVERPEARLFDDA